MPTYQYRCTECGNDLEVVQKFTDPSLSECPTCQGGLRKVYNAVGVVFKGSGFYKTDSRTNGTAKSTASTQAKDGDADETTTSSEKKPAKETTAAAAPSTSGQATAPSGSSSASSSTAKATTGA